MFFGYIQTLWLQACQFVCVCVCVCVYLFVCNSKNYYFNTFSKTNMKRHIHALNVKQIIIIILFYFMFLKFINAFNLNINKPSCSGIKDQNWWSNKGPMQHIEAI